MLLSASSSFFPSSKWIHWKSAWHQRLTVYFDVCQSKELPINRIYYKLKPLILFIRFVFDIFGFSVHCVGIHTSRIETQIHKKKLFNERKKIYESQVSIPTCTFVFALEYHLHYEARVFLPTFSYQSHFAFIMFYDLLMLASITFNARPISSVTIAIWERKKKVCEM